MQQVGRWQCGDFGVKVDAVQQRSAEPALVARHLVGRVAAGSGRVAEKAARAGVHRCHQLEPGREHALHRGARNADVAAFQRFVQCFEGGARWRSRQPGRRRFRGPRWAWATAGPSRCRRPVPLRRPRLRGGIAPPPHPAGGARGRPAPAAPGRPLRRCPAGQHQPALRPAVRVAVQRQAHRQRAAHRPQLAAQRQLARELPARRPRAVELPRRRQDAQRDGQVEAARVGQDGRREVDRDALVAGEFQACVGDRPPARAPP